MPLLVDLDNPKLSRDQKRIIANYDKVYVGSYKAEGWSDHIAHYAFLCKRHGYVVDYPHGYYSPGKGTIPVKLDDGTVSQLYCPKCEKASHERVK